MKRVSSMVMKVVMVTVTVTVTLTVTVAVDDDDNDDDEEEEKSRRLLEKEKIGKPGEKNPLAQRGLNLLLFYRGDGPHSTKKKLLLLGKNPRDLPSSNQPSFCQNSCRNICRVEFPSFVWRDDCRTILAHHNSSCTLVLMAKRLRAHAQTERH